MKAFSNELDKVKKSHFSFLSNALIYVLVGAFCVFLGCLQFSFIQEKKDFIQTAIYEQAKRDGKNEYQKEILEDTQHKELSKLVDKWNKKWNTK